MHTIPSTAASCHISPYQFHLDLLSQGPFDSWAIHAAEISHSYPFCYTTIVWRCLTAFLIDGRILTTINCRGIDPILYRHNGIRRGLKDAFFCLSCISFSHPFSPQHSTLYDGQQMIGDLKLHVHIKYAVYHKEMYYPGWDKKIKVTCSTAL